MYLNRWIDGDQKDGLSYNYNGNQLSKVNDSKGSEGFNNSYSGNDPHYGYDSNCNATSDKNRGIGDGALKYNILNLPREITNSNYTLKYHYDATGTKLRMENSNGAANTKYAGAFEYNNQSYITRIATEEGQISVTNNGANATDYSFEYYLRDHLGNTRMVMNEAGTILQETEYFPFGLAIPRSGTDALNKYLFNGIERQPETGVYQARFRGLDPTIGRWMQIDPKPDQSMSLYAAMNNNPVRYPDPLGDTIIVNNRGYVTRNDKSDNLVFMQGKKGKLTSLGELGKKINISEIYKSLLKSNSKTAAGIINPYTFKDLVKSKGEWDYKANKNTIYGLGNGKSMESQDIGNHHFGVVANAYGFGQEFSLKQAGIAQMQGGTSRPEWQIYGASEIIGWTPNGPITTKPMLAPYGDDPRDQSYIKEGYKYYDQNKEE